MAKAPETLTLNDAGTWSSHNHDVPPKREKWNKPQEGVLKVKKEKGGSMEGLNTNNRSEGQLELCTESKCEWCEEDFTPKNRNGLAVRFCRKACSVAWHNNQKVKGAAMIKKKTEQKKARRKRLRKPIWNNQTTQRLCLDMIPADQRPALLAQAAKNLGLVESPVLTVARQVGAICDMTIKKALPSPFLSPNEIRLKAALETDPEKQLKLEAMLGVIEASMQEVAA